MSIKVTITAANRSPSEAVLAIFKNAGIEVDYKPSLTEDELIKAGKESDGMLVGHNPGMSKRALEACSKVKVVSRNGVGVDSVDLNAANELGVCVCNTPGINSSEVADHAMALLLSLNRQVLTLSELVQTGQWSRQAGIAGPYWNQLRRIAGSTVGIYGFGNIGRTFATTVRGFGPLRVIAHDKYVPENLASQLGVELVDFETLLKSSDYISLHAPDTKETHHAFDLNAFKKMKKEAVLINCARGGLVMESALKQALDEGMIRAAAIDVLEEEPIPEDSPLLNMKNLLITPHLAGGSDYTGREGSKRWAENVVLVLQGKRPHGIANPKVASKIDELCKNKDVRWQGFSPPSI